MVISRKFSEKAEIKSLKNGKECEFKLLNNHKNQKN